MPNIERRIIIDDELDHYDGRDVLSCQVVDENDQVLVDLVLDRGYTPQQIADTLRSDALDILLNASEKVSAEEILYVVGLLTETARQVLNTK